MSSPGESDANGLSKFSAYALAVGQEELPQELLPRLEALRASLTRLEAVDVEGVDPILEYPRPS